MRPGTDVQRDATVYCNDGPVGLVRQVVVDDQDGEVTDLVVERDGGERLVIPVSMVAHADGPSVTLALSRAEFRDDLAARLRYRPEEFRPREPHRDEGARPAAGGRPARPEAPAGPGAEATRPVSTAAAGAPAAPAPRRLDTTDPLAIEPFVEAVLRIPVRGEQLVAERRAVVAHELVVRKRLRRETVEVRGRVRKERVDADQPSGDRPERRPEARDGEVQQREIKAPQRTERRPGSREGA
jgi:hypothetical protein